MAQNTENNENTDNNENKPVDVDEQDPNDDSNLSEQQKETIKEEEKQNLLQIAAREAKIASYNLFLKITQLLLIFGFGLLLIVGIAGIVLYVLDIFADILEFPFDEYTQYIIIGITILNVIASLFGCFATYRFGTINEETARLGEVANNFGKQARKTEQIANGLKDQLRALEVKHKHIQGEHKELRKSLKEFGKLDKDILNTSNSVGKQTKSIKKIYKMFRKERLYRLNVNVTELSAAYYDKAYEDNNREDGLDKREFNSLLLVAVRSSDRQYFPKFDDKRWNKHPTLGTIMIDDFENLVKKIYKTIQIIEDKELDNIAKFSDKLNAKQKQTAIDNKKKQQQKNNKQKKDKQKDKQKK